MNLVRFAFTQLYTNFAWTYDAVAALVSFGEWQEWGRAVIPFILTGARVLELAHGPGHLHLTLRQMGFHVVGIDLSLQMGRMAWDRMISSKHPERSDAMRSIAAKSKDAPLLVRANAMRLPFADARFDCVVSTFPAEFIFRLDTLNEVRRVLQPGGRFAIVPGAQIRGDDLLAQAIRLAYHVTGQGEAPSDTVRRLFNSAGFEFEQLTVKTQRADVTVWVCIKPSVQ